MPRRRQPTLGEKGEFELIKSVLRVIPTLASEVEVGPGDDCAVLRFGKQHLVISVDAQIEGVHFRWPWLSPAALGRRSFHVSVSDLAAMGATPRWLVVHYTAPPSFPAAALRALQRGLAKEAALHGVGLVGGNLSRGRQLNVVVTAIGTQKSRPVQRAGARVGDGLFVSGTLGDAASAVRAWRAGRRPAAALLRRFVQPTARIALGQGLARHDIASAMIDVSDGLLQDLGHLCRASKVGVAVDTSRIPVSAAYRRANGSDLSLALRGGEDYELLSAIPESKVGRVQRLARESDCVMTHIGWFTAAPGVRLVGAAAIQRGGFDHFKS